MPASPAPTATYFREETDSLLAITATALDINDTAFPGSKDVLIRADVLRVRGQIKCPGKTIRIVARVLQADAGTILDVSGEDQQAIPARADPGGTPGARGHDGAPGVAGQPGGKIYIFAGAIKGTLELRANGGRGGAGQGGGHGEQGGNGPNGADHDGSSSGSGAPGGTGMTGGNGGNGGAGGVGGAAGEIILKTSVAPAPGVLSFEATAGQGGPGGSAGTGGPGGNGGLGGLSTICFGHPGIP